MVTICSVLGMLGICSIEDIRKKEIQSVRVLCFGIGGILLHLWQRNQSLYSMLGGSSYYSVTGVWWNYWNWRWTGTLCSGNLHWRNQYHASAFDGTFPVLSVCTGIAVHAQKKTKRHHSFYSVSAGSISHSVDFIRQWKKKCYLPASYTIEAAVIVPVILAIFCTLIVVSYELHDRVKLAAEESSKNKIECMEEIYIGDML